MPSCPHSHVRLPNFETQLLVSVKAANSLSSSEGLKGIPQVTPRGYNPQPTGPKSP